MYVCIQYLSAKTLFCCESGRLVVQSFSRPVEFKVLESDSCNLRVYFNLRVKEAYR